MAAWGCDLPPIQSPIRASLLTSASALALSLTGYGAQAQALLSPNTSWSPWIVWVEGGLFQTGGPGVSVPMLPGLAAPFTLVGPKGGYYGAAGFDFDYGGSWHVVGDVLYGWSRKAAASVHQHYFSSFGDGYFSSTNSVQSATERESHLVADLMIGRDFGLGTSTAQLQYGIRVADLAAITNVNQAATSFFSSFFRGAGSGTSMASGTFRARFFGGGPRLALAGDLPLSGVWSVDYLVGIAELAGTRSMSYNVTNATGAPASGNSSSVGLVFNADGWAALSYALTPAYKISAGVRADYYSDVLSAYDASINGTRNIDRLFWGPFLRLSGKF